MTTIKQRYEAYVQECAKMDAGRHGAVLREMTPQEQSLYDDWQQAIRDCMTWHDEETGTTWHILNRWDNCGLEMWHCRLEKEGEPTEIADCYACFVRELGQPVDDEISVAHNS
jgi:hypothetical protein